jgi:DNA-binding CsgD family transcriptional regulator
VADGRTFLNSRTQQWLEDGPKRPDELPPREMEVVKLIAEANTNRQIADVLQVSEKTVESHRANVLSKLGMRDRVATSATQSSTRSRSSRTTLGLRRPDTGVLQAGLRKSHYRALLTGHPEAACAGSNYPARAMRSLLLLGKAEASEGPPTTSRVPQPSRSSTVLCLEPYFPSCLKAEAWCPENSRRYDSLHELAERPDHHLVVHRIDACVAGGGGRKACCASRPTPADDPVAGLDGMGGHMSAVALIDHEARVRARAGG